VSRPSVTAPRKNELPFLSVSAPGHQASQPLAALAVGVGPAATPTNTAPGQRSRAIGVDMFVRTIRTECLDQFVVFGERHLRHLVGTFVDHYLTGRYHQGLRGQLIRPPTLASNDNGSAGAIQCRSKLGGLLNFYWRDTA
jgi:hypothetical protein